MAKIKFITQYNKCKTDADRARTILKRMGADWCYNYICKGQKRGTYEVGPRWDGILIDSRIFSLIKSKTQKKVGLPMYFKNRKTKRLKT